MSNPNRQPYFWKRKIEQHVAREQQDVQSAESSKNKPSSKPAQPDPPHLAHRHVGFGKKISRPTSQPVTSQQVATKQSMKPVDNRPYERAPFPSPALPAMEISVTAIISFFDKKGIFHIWPGNKERIERFHEWQDKWQVEFEKLPSLDPSRLMYGSPCLVRYAKDSKWYRATYLGIREDKRHVFFEEFGTIEPIADTDFKEADPQGKIGYEIPCELYSCHLARPDKPQKYFVMGESNIDCIQNLIASQSSEDRQRMLFDFDILAYRRFHIYGRDRTLLVVGITTIKGVHFDEVLLDGNEATEEADLDVPPVTFSSEPDFRACAQLRFPEPLFAPLNERVSVRINQYNPEEKSIVVSYFPVPREQWGQVSLSVKAIYGDAAVLESCEETWTEIKGSLTPTKAVTLGNSYLVEHEGRVRRGELDAYVDVDENGIPVLADVSLIDGGSNIIIECSKILDFPRVIVSEVPQQAFCLLVDFTLSGNSSTGRESAEENKSVVGVPRAVALTDNTTSLTRGRGLGLQTKLKTVANDEHEKRVVDSVEKLKKLVGCVVEMETLQRQFDDLDIARIYI